MGKVSTYWHRARLVLAPPRTLGEVEARVVKGWPQVVHLTPAQAAAQVACGSAMLVDVRTERECALSHIVGATRSSGQDIPSPAAGVRLIILYCAVGIRSARLAMRLGRVVRGPADTTFANLSGGIFRWHAEGRALENDHGRTRALHPYSARWQHLTDCIAMHRSRIVE